MRPKIYIDGKEGTTGLQIYERLGARDDLELLLIDEEKRKDTEERRKLLNAADIVFLCLPDAAAREAVSLIENDHTRVIDASTAHRTADGWAYGFPELSDDHRAAIQTSTRVANPGCHATGFIASVYPLVTHGVLSATDALTCFSLTGYSGGGKKMIASYEAEDKTDDLYAPRVYGLNLQHKHLPEMQKVCGLATPPVGINLYVASSVGGQPVHKIIPHLPIPLLAIFIGTMLVILIPDIVIFLPNLMNGAAG